MPLSLRTSIQKKRAKKKFTRVLKTLTIVRRSKISLKRYIDFNKYSYEFMWCGIFTISLIFFIKGRSTNDTIANNFNKGIAEVISTNFAHFGT
jgi:hypothetical protein